MTSSIAEQTLYNRTGFLLQGGFLLAGFLLLVLIAQLQQHLDHRINRSAVQMEELAQLPRGEHLKPAMLGYHHLGADGLWLRLVQVIGKKKNTVNEYDWIYHALDVLTTLDPHYTYTYYVGGIILTDVGNRPDLSNRLLEKGHRENPKVWNIPFLLGYNHYFLLGDPIKGSEYISRAARIPGRPAYLPGLATRMYAEAGNLDVALSFLEALWKETTDPQMRVMLENRAKEVIIERDIRIIESAVKRFQSMHKKLPVQLQDLIRNGYLVQLPREPFSGEYRLDQYTGEISSSTHPERLRTFFKLKKDTTYLYPTIQQPAYIFPKTW